MAHCDFCYAEVMSKSELRITTNDFLAPPIAFEKKKVIMMSIGDWCVCPSCQELIMKQNWNGLEDRVLEMEGMLHTPFEQQFRSALQQLWASFKQNQTTSSNSNN